MKKIRVIETQRLTTEDVRGLCCEFGLYTHGTNRDYEAMFARVRNLRGPIITAEDLYPIADDIKVHSDTEQDVASIMWALGSKIQRHYEVEEVEEPDLYVVTCECTDDGPEFMLYCDGKKHRQYEEIVASFKTRSEAVAYMRSLCSCEGWVEE